MSVLPPNTTLPNAAVIVTTMPLAIIMEPVAFVRVVPLGLVFVVGAGGAVAGFHAEPFHVYQDLEAASWPYTAPL